MPNFIPAFVLLLSIPFVFIGVAIFSNIMEKRSRAKMALTEEVELRELRRHWFPWRDALDESEVRGRNDAAFPVAAVGRRGCAPSSSQVSSSQGPRGGGSTAGHAATATVGAEFVDVPLGNEERPNTGRGRDFTSQANASSSHAGREEYPAKRTTEIPGHKEHDDSNPYRKHFDVPSSPSAREICSINRPTIVADPFPSSTLRGADPTIPRPAKLASTSHRRLPPLAAGPSTAVLTSTSGQAESSSQNAKWQHQPTWGTTTTKSTKKNRPPFTDPDPGLPKRLHEVGCVDRRVAFHEETFVIGVDGDEDEIADGATVDESSARAQDKGKEKACDRADETNVRWI